MLTAGSTRHVGLKTLVWTIYFESLKLSLHFIKCVHVMCDVRVILFCLAQRCDWCWPVCCWAQSYCSMAQTKVNLYRAALWMLKTFFGSPFLFALWMFEHFLSWSVCLASLVLSDEGQMAQGKKNSWIYQPSNLRVTSPTRFSLYAY